MASRAVCFSTSTYPPHVGGVAVASARVAAWLAAAGYDVHVVVPDPAAPGDTAGRVSTLEGAGLTVHRVRHPDPLSAAGHFALRRAIQEIDAAVGFALFHGFFLMAAYPCVQVVGPRRTRPVIASIRGGDTGSLLDQPFVRPALVAVLKSATWVTSVSDAYLARAAEEVPLAGRSSVIRSGVALPVDGGAPWQPTAENRGRVGTVGEFRKVKDIPLLVRAYAGVPPAARRKLLLIGAFADADEAQWSATLMDEFGIAAQTEVTGLRPHAEVPAHLRGLHVYVQPSAYEGLPNALLEALSLGVPIVSTAVGGMREVLTDGVSALLVPHGDPRAMSAAITRLLTDDGLAAHLSAGARALAQRMRPEDERDAWLALYAALLGPPSGP
jgi:L-malate glycosyltransferase